MPTSPRGTQKSTDPPGTPPISKSTLCSVDERSERNKSAPKKIPPALNRTAPPPSPRNLFNSPVSNISPLGTPPTSSMSDDFSADLPFNRSAAPKKNPLPFNRTFPPPAPRAPHTLFSSVSSSDRNNAEGHKSPPSVRRKWQEKPVFLWEIEDDDDIPSHSDSSGDFMGISDMAMLSGDVPTPHRKRTSLSEKVDADALGISDRSPLRKRTSLSERVDVASDPGNRRSRDKTYTINIATKQGKSISDAAGPTSPPSLSSRWKNGANYSPPKRGSKSNTKEQPRGDIPQSPDEHAARLKEIMNKREKKKRGKKSKRQSDTASSIVSGASSNSRRSSNVSNYADDPVNYLNEKLTEKEKAATRSDGANSAVSSKDYSRSTVSSLGSKSSARASNGKLRDAKIEKKRPPSIIDADKGSDASSDISGASNTSSIFAATRAKLKGYLKSYKKSDKKKSQKDSNKSTDPAASQLSPARESSRESPSGSERNQGTPSTLFSIEESDSDSPRRTIRSNDSPKTPASRSRKNFEEKISHLSTPPSSSAPSFPEIVLPQIHESDESHARVEGDATTKVLDLPWRYDGKGGSLNGKSTADQKYVGLYSGPVNEVLQPHGKGKLVLKGNNSEVFYGTWEEGRLVSPLTDEEEPVTDDEDDVSDVSSESDEKPTQTGISAALNNCSPQSASIKYAINRHYSNSRLSVENIVQRESAALRRARAKTLRKSKPKLIPKYSIGDPCRTPQDMIICRSKEAALESADLLKKWDGAFVKRSCGVWTYAVLIERALQPMDVMKRRLEYLYWKSVWEVDPRCEMEDSMLFAIDGDGGTKIIPKHAWAKYVRRIQCSNIIPNTPRRDEKPASSKIEPVPTEIAFDTDGPEPNGLMEPSNQDGDNNSDEEAQICYAC